MTHSVCSQRGGGFFVAAGCGGSFGGPDFAGLERWMCDGCMVIAGSLLAIAAGSKSVGRQPCGCSDVSWKLPCSV